MSNGRPSLSDAENAEIERLRQLSDQDMKIIKMSDERCDNPALTTPEENIFLKGI